MSSSVSRRIEEAIRSLHAGNIENCLLNLFPAIDKVSKKRRPQAGVRERIVGFLTDEEGLITGMAMRVTIQNTKINDITLPEFLYQYGRNTIVHEGELDSRLSFTPDGLVLIGKEKWELTQDLIIAIIVAVVIAPESKHERLENDFNLRIFRKIFNVNSMWGEREKIYQIVFGLD